MIQVSREGKVCLPREILTIARSSRRGMLLEVVSGDGKPYALLVRHHKSNTRLLAIHKCYAVSKQMACKHIRSALIYAERWLGRTLPNEFEVDVRWLDKKELTATEDLTPLLLNREGVFKTIKLKGRSEDG